jgi:thiol-disulfide isomerase/thioredoxin
MTEVALLLAVLAGATLFGLWRRRNDGRLRPVLHVDMAPHVADPAGGTAEQLASAGAIEDPSDEATRGPLAADPAGDVAPRDPAGVASRGGAPTARDQAGGPSAAAPLALTAGDVGRPLGERATLVQFSSAFCQPCRATRLVLADVARTVPGVTHVEIDAESRLDLVRRVDVTRTPTVLILDAAGRVRTRATGAPRSADVLGALGAIL